MWEVIMLHNSSFDPSSPSITNNFNLSQNVHFTFSVHAESMVPSTPNIECHNISRDQNVPSTPVTQKSEFQRVQCLLRSSPAVSVARLQSTPLSYCAPPSFCSLDQLVPTTPQDLLQSTRSRREDIGPILSETCGDSFADQPSASSALLERAQLATSHNLSKRRQTLSSRRKLSLNQSRKALQLIPHQNGTEGSDGTAGHDIDETARLSLSVPGDPSSLNSRPTIRMLNRSNMTSVECGSSSPGNVSPSRFLSDINSPPRSSVMSSSVNKQTLLSSDLNSSQCREKITTIRRSFLVSRILGSHPSAYYQDASPVDCQQMQLFEDPEIFM